MALYIVLSILSNPSVIYVVHIKLYGIIVMGNMEKVAGCNNEERRPVYEEKKSYKRVIATEMMTRI